MAESMQRHSNFFHGGFACNHVLRFYGCWILFASVRYAVVTGANKGIGLEICKQLACKGIMVVLTARDEKRGLQALENLKHLGLSDHLVFHQLDVADPESINSLADFVKKQFGKLDILVSTYICHISRTQLFHIYIFSWFFVMKDFHNIQWSFLCL